MTRTVRILKYLGFAIWNMLPKRQIGVTTTTIVMNKSL
jgi:hypothetical protein